jgi:hypothetical protein
MFVGIRPKHSYKKLKITLGNFLFYRILSIVGEKAKLIRSIFRVSPVVPD